MVNTFEHLPSPPLRKYVRCYVLREFDTQGQEMCKAITAVPGMFITFWLDSEPVTLVNGDRKLIVNVRERQLVGMQSGYLGHLAFKGKYKIFGIEFKGNGFHQIFGVPANGATNELLETDLVIGAKMDQLQEQLREAGSIHELYALADAFLLSFLLRNDNGKMDKRINGIADTILYQNGLVNIEVLAGQSNMSLRGFEQKFAEQVGLSPKLYARIIRFNHALAIKTLMPARNWTSIAHSCGYYDQMHFIKDFKAFAGQSPNSFLKHLPQPKEHITVLDAG